MSSSCIVLPPRGPVPVGIGPVFPIARSDTRVSPRRTGCNGTRRNYPGQQPSRLPVAMPSVHNFSSQFRSRARLRRSSSDETVSCSFRNARTLSVVANTRPAARQHSARMLSSSKLASVKLSDPRNLRTSAKRPFADSQLGFARSSSVHSTCHACVTSRSPLGNPSLCGSHRLVARAWASRSRSRTCSSDGSGSGRGCRFGLLKQGVGHVLRRRRAKLDQSVADQGEDLGHLGRRRKVVGVAPE
jgi:hypothetical protein